MPAFKPDAKAVVLVGVVFQEYEYAAVPPVATASIKPVLLPKQSTLESLLSGVDTERLNRGSLTVI